MRLSIFKTLRLKIWQYVMLEDNANYVNKKVEMLLPVDLS